MATKATVKYPTAVELRTTGFGRPDKDHSAVQEACAETNLFIILKSGLLTRVERDTLRNTGPLIDHLIWTTDALNNYNFSWLRQPDKTWESQADIPAESKKAMLVCLFHYDLNVLLLMRYLGGNYVGAHRDVESTALTLRKHSVPENLIRHYKMLDYLRIISGVAESRHVRDLVGDGSSR